MDRKKVYPLGISLFIHTLAIGLFLFWFLHDAPKKSPEPLKIHISSFVPHSVQKPTPVIPAPLPAVPPKQTITPIPKSFPLPSVVTKSPIAKITPAPTVSHPIPQTQSQPPVQAPAVIPTQTPKAPAVAPTPPPPPVNVEKEFLNAHLGEIRGLLLQNLKYPKIAQKLKMQGEVRIAFSLGTDGSVENVKVVESSGFEILDEDAVSLIEKTASKFPKPSKSVRITVPLSYVLR
ncbi:MAG: energy transducer TonB [Sulfuricurvum sp.]|nr:energy transducer TonB [Sulfuricurvum sp.]